MEPVVLDCIPFRVDLPELLKTVHIAAEGEDALRVKELAQAAEAVARPGPSVARRTSSRKARRAW